MEQKDSAERILKQIPYEIMYSVRKTLAVQVKADGSVVVRAPKRMAKYKIEAFLKEKQDWIHTHREKALAAAEQKAANRLTEAERKAAVKRAAQMLADTGKPVTEIALDCGFSGPGYFARQFRQITGKTPTAYRGNVGALPQTPPET